MLLNGGKKLVDIERFAKYLFDPTPTGRVVEQRAEDRVEGRDVRDDERGRRDGRQRRDRRGPPRVVDDDAASGELRPADRRGRGAASGPGRPRRRCGSRHLAAGQQACDRKGHRDRARTQNARQPSQGPPCSARPPSRARVFPTYPERMEAHGTVV